MVDLVASSLTSSPEHPIVGEQVRLELTIVNRSGNDARGVRVTLFAGKNEIASNTADVGARQKVRTSLLWTPKAAGTYSLVAIVDPDRRFVEENRADNVISTVVAVSAAGQQDAELAVSDVEVTSSGDRTLVRSRVQNRGTVAASTPVVIRVQDRVITVLKSANTTSGLVQ
jgi:subtilase family serine protease